MAKLEEDPEKSPAEELQQMEDMVADANGQLGDVIGDLEKSAQQSAALANKLKAQLPKELQKAADAVVVAANDVLANGPEEGRKEKLADAVKTLDDLVNATEGLVPADDQSSLKALQRELDDALPKKKDEPQSRVEKLDELARKDGVTPPEAARELLQNADQLDQLMDNIKDAMERGKDKKPNVELARAVNSIHPPILAMAKASGDLLLAHEQGIKDASAKSQDDLADAQKKLDDAAKKVDEITKEMGKGKNPTPAQVAKLASARKDARIAAQRAKSALDPKVAPDLFDNPASKTMREVLDDVARDPERDDISPEEAKKEAEKLAGEIKSAQKELGDYKKGIEPLAQKKAQLANKLASALPALGTKANDRLVVSANDVVQDGPGEGRKEKLLDDLKKLEDLRDALSDVALGELPSAPERTDVDGVGEAAKKLIGKDETPKEKSHSDRLEDAAKKSGDQPSDPAKRLAESADKVEKALDDMEKSTEKDPINKDGLNKSLAEAAPAASDLSHAVKDLLQDRAEELKKDGELAQETLEDDAKGLGAIAQELKALEEAASKKPGGGSPEEAKKVEEARKKLDKALDQALGDLAPSRNPDLFDDPTTEKLRDDLRDLQKSLGDDKIPANKAKDEAARLGEAAQKAADKIEDYNNGMPDKAAEKARQAKDLARDLPKAIRNADAALVAAASDVLAKGPEDGRKEKLEKARDNLDDLVDTSTSLLPSDRDHAPLRSLQRDLAKHEAQAPPLPFEEEPKHEAAKGVEDAAKKAGDEPDKNALKVGESVDQAASALDELALAVSDPNHVGGLPDALDEAAPALNDLAQALADMLEEEPEKIRDAAKKAKEGLKERQKELDDLKKEMDKIKNRIKGGKPTPQDAKDLAAYKKKFREVVQKALEDIDPSKNGIFGNLKSNKLRAFLNGKLEALGDPEKDEQMKPEDVAEELKKMEDHADDAKKQIGDYVNKLDREAEEAAEEAKELATELPKYTRNLKSRLVSSSRGVMAKGPDEDLVKQMMSSKDQLSQLLGDAASLLPGAKKKGELGAILDKVKKQNKLGSTSQDTGVKEKNASKKLDQLAKQKGQSPSEAMYRVARACERLDSSLDEVLKAVSGGEKLDALADSTSVTAEALEELADALPPMLEGVVEDMEKAAEIAVDALDSHEQELNKLNERLAEIQKSVEGKGGKPDQKDIEAMNKLKEDFAKFSERAAADVAVSKNSNLFGHPKAAKLRALLNKNAKQTPNPKLTPEQAKEELENLTKAMSDTESNMGIFKESIDNIVSQNTSLAKDLMDQLPRIAGYFLPPPLPS